MTCFNRQVSKAIVHSGADEHEDRVRQLGQHVWNRLCEHVEPLVRFEISCVENYEAPLG